MFHCKPVTGTATTTVPPLLSSYRRVVTVAVAVAVSVAVAVAVAVAGLPKRFLNQCLGLYTTHKDDVSRQGGEAVTL